MSYCQAAPSSYIQCCVEGSTGYGTGMLGGESRNGEPVLGGHTQAQPAQHPAFPPRALTGQLWKKSHVPDQEGSTEKLRKCQNGKK